MSSLWNCKIFGREPNVLKTRHTTRFIVFVYIAVMTLICVSEMCLSCM